MEHDTSSSKELHKRIEELERQNADLREALDHAQKQQDGCEAKTELPIGEEERFRAIFEHSPLAIMCTDKDGNITDSNSNACTLFGLPREKLVGSSYTQIADPRMRHAIEKALAGERSRFEGDYPTVSTKTLIPMSADFSPLSLSDGTISGAIGIFKDIRERRQTEKDLILSKNRLSAVRELGMLATSSPDLDEVLQRVLEGTTAAAGASVGMIFLKDRQSGLFKWGASLGLSDDFVSSYRDKKIRLGEGLTGRIAQTGEPIFIPEDSSTDPRIARPVVIKEDLHSYIGVPLFAGKEIIGVMNILTRKPDVLHEEEITLIGAIGSHVGSAILNAQLFKQLKEAEISLRAKQDFMDTLIDSLNDTFFVFEVNTGKAIRWNRIFATVSGYSDLEIAELKAPDAYYTEKDLNKMKAAADLLSRQGRASVQAELVTKNKQKIPFEYAATLIESPDNAEPLIISIGRDLTERNKMEKELLNAQKLESIGILAGGIAHDFNNLLTGILGNISLAKVHVTGNDLMTEILDRAENASVMAQNLTQQLLTFSKGGMPVRRSVNIGSIIKDTAAFALHGSNVSCRYLLADDLFNAELDEGQISQVFQNLLINAIHAMPEGGEVTISANNYQPDPQEDATLQEKHYILISVKDHGCGISEKDINKIFDPYFTTKPMGSGLGLATCYSIIKNHGGHIAVESEIDVGTTFYVYLPASDERVQGKRPQPHDLPAKFNRKFLIMDDEEHVKRVASAMLKRLGCEVATASDGREAIDIYRQAQEQGHPFDAVIMDLTIPGGMGGKEAVSRLLEIDPLLRAIASSGYSNDPVLADYRQYGFSGCLSKPYTFEEFTEALQRIFPGALR